MATYSPHDIQDIHLGHRVTSYGSALLQVPIDRLSTRETTPETLSLLDSRSLEGRGNSSMRTASIQGLQRTYGNRAVQRSLARPALPGGARPVQRSGVPETPWWEPVSFGGGGAGPANIPQPSAPASSAGAQGGWAGDIAGNTWGGVDGSSAAMLANMEGYGGPAQSAQAGAVGGGYGDILGAALGGAAGGWLPQLPTWEGAAASPTGGSSPIPGIPIPNIPIPSPSLPEFVTDYNPPDIAGPFMASPESAEYIGQTASSITEALDPVSTAASVLDYTSYIGNPTKQAAAAVNALFGAEQTVGADGKASKGPSLFDRGVDWMIGGIGQEAQSLAGQVADVPVLGSMAQGAASAVDFQTQFTSGALKATGNMVGSLSQMVKNPEDAAKAAWKMGENFGLPGFMNPLRQVRAAYDVATGEREVGDALNNWLNPIESIRQSSELGETMATSLAAPYQEAWDKERYGEMVGRGVVDIGSLLLGVGETSAAGKAARVGEAGEVARGADVAEASRAAEVGTGAKAPPQKVMQMDVVPENIQPGMAPPPGWRSGPYGELNTPGPVNPYAPTMPGTAPVSPTAPTLPGTTPISPTAPTLPGTSPISPTAPTLPEIASPYAPTLPGTTPISPSAPTLPGLSPVSPVAPTLPSFGPPVSPFAPTIPMPAMPTPFFPPALPDLSGLSGIWEGLKYLL